MIDYELIRSFINVFVREAKEKNLNALINKNF